MTPSAETKTVAEAASELLAKLDEAMKPIANAITIAAIHGITYHGPTIDGEMEVLRAALARQAAALARGEP